MPNLRGKTWTATTPAKTEDANYWEDHLIDDESYEGLQALLEGGAGGGHVIVNAAGTEMPQQPNLQFINATVANGNGVTIVSGNGEKGDAATVTVGTTTTGAPGTQASVTNSGTSSAAVLDFTIPAGVPGVFVVNVDNTQSTLVYTPDKTYTEVRDALKGGQFVIAIVHTTYGNELYYVRDYPIDTNTTGNIQFYGIRTYSSSQRRRLVYQTGGMNSGLDSLTGSNIYAANPVTSTSTTITTALADINTVAQGKISQTTKEVTLSAASWASGVYTISDTDITATNTVTLTYPPTTSDADYTALQAAAIRTTGQTAGSITIKALGAVPTSDLTITLIIEG